MVVPRKWKLVAGTMSATVALGAGTALAQEGDESADPDTRSALTEVVDIESLPQLEGVDEAAPLPTQFQVQDEDESPFDSIAGDSVSAESESLSSAESDSADSTSIPSAESDSADSASVPSAESESAESAD